MSAGWLPALRMQQLVRARRMPVQLSDHQILLATEHGLSSRPGPGGNGAVSLLFASRTNGLLHEVNASGAAPCRTVFQTVRPGDQWHPGLPDWKSGLRELWLPRFEIKQRDSSPFPTGLGRFGFWEENRIPNPGRGNPNTKIRNPKETRIPNPQTDNLRLVCDNRSLWSEIIRIEFGNEGRSDCRFGGFRKAGALPPPSCVFCVDRPQPPDNLLFDVLVAAMYVFIYYLNQRAVRVEFEPRWQELLASLGEEIAVNSTPINIEKLGQHGLFLFIATLFGAGMARAVSAGDWRSLTFFGLFLFFFLMARTALADGGLFGSSSKYDGPAVSSGPQGESLAALTTKLRKQKNLVGLAAMVTVDGQVVATAAVGERKSGSGVPLDLGDRWHLGSITKSITATMIVRLIEAEQLQWAETVGERFPEASRSTRTGSLSRSEQLLTHTSGAPANFSFKVLRKAALSLALECTRERRDAVLDVMAKKPKHAPGQKYAYSNVGYTIAAAMAEQSTGISWEDLVKREVFEPLELAEAGFGPPKSPSETLDQPRGHGSLFGLKSGADDDQDNTPIMGPAGTVHMTLSNLSKYAADHMNGQVGKGKLLAHETYQRLHTAKLDDYACGWVVKQSSDEIPHTVYWHNGSNTMWYALVVFIPDMKMVVAVTSNDGDITQAESAAWEIVKSSVKQEERAVSSDSK